MQGLRPSPVASALADSPWSSEQVTRPPWSSAQMADSPWSSEQAASSPWSSAPVADSAWSSDQQASTSLRHQNTWHLPKSPRHASLQHHNNPDPAPRQAEDEQMPQNATASTAALLAESDSSSQRLELVRGVNMALQSSGEQGASVGVEVWLQQQSSPVAAQRQAENGPTMQQVGFAS